MRILIKYFTKSGDIIHQKIDKVDKVFFFDDEKAVFQIDKDFKKSEAKRGQGENK